jgi:hypothetical protein
MINEDAAGTLSARKYMLLGQSFSESTKGEAADKLDSANLSKNNNESGYECI